MSELGIQAAIQRAVVSSPAAQQHAVSNALVQAPALARVHLPPREAGEERTKPKKQANQFANPRDMRMGTSPLSTASLADAFAGTSVLDTAGDASHVQADVGSSPEKHGGNQSRVAAKQLPAASELMAFAKNSRGETIYLEQSRWAGHIVPSHITDPPVARGKRTTTWWPVLHSATGASTMDKNQVVGVIMDAVREGHWQNAPRGTMLAVYDLPANQAQKFGVSEVKVSAAPDGRILSAYPSAGSNVLAVRELNAEEQSAVAAMKAAQQPTSPFTAQPAAAGIANATTFG